MTEDELKEAEEYICCPLIEWTQPMLHERAKRVFEYVRNLERQIEEMRSTIENERYLKDEY